VRYRVRWLGEPESSLSTLEELDALLDRVAAECGDNGLAHEVHVFNWGETGKFLGIMLGVGHPERSFVYFYDESVAEFGYQPEVAEYGQRVAFDQVVGSSPLYPPPALTRVTPAVARQAAGDYVTTGRRPTCLHWQPLTFWSGFTDEELAAIEQWHDGIQY
jgi:hypothetical protein